MRPARTLASGVGSASYARYSHGMSVSGVLRSVRPALIGGVAALGACDPARVITWEEMRSLPSSIGETTVLTLRGDSGVALAPAPAGPPGGAGPACAGSVRVADDGEGGAFAAWWVPREDSSVMLVVSHRAAGDDSTWGAPVTADARDRGKGGCDRPAPAISADASRGYVHLAYFLDAPSGAGVYGGHSMENGTYFHDPVAIVYGERVVPASVATSGDIVAVAYEDPNSARARVAVALSLTAGHIYEYRVEASPSTMRATDPRVAIAGRRLAVAWSAEEWEQGSQGSRAMMRVGTIGDDAKPGAGGDEQ